MKGKWGPEGPRGPSKKTQFSPQPPSPASEYTLSVFCFGFKGILMALVTETRGKTWYSQFSQFFAICRNFPQFSQFFFFNFPESHIKNLKGMSVLRARKSKPSTKKYMCGVSKWSKSHFWFKKNYLDWKNLTPFLELRKIWPTRHPGAENWYQFIAIFFS